MNLDILFQIATGVLIPLVGFLISQINDNKRELNELRVKIAGEYAVKSDLIRLENKIDQLQNLILSMKKDSVQ